MKPKDIPPNWQAILANTASIAQYFGDESLQALIRRANNECLHWAELRHKKMPPKVTPEIAWAFIKMARFSNREALPIRTESDVPFSIYASKEQQRILSYIDSYTSGVITSSEGLPDARQSERLVIDGLIEEAISSSQLEGASTTRKVAKAMIEQRRDPKTKDERMIYNNYHAMTQIEAWKNRDLDDSLLLDLHRVLSTDTMENSNDEGRFRVDSDDVVISDRLTGDVVHVPPPTRSAKAQLKQLYSFINKEDESYTHPFIKASVLHFSIGYIHPFVDGNGRVARALFYWFLIKKGYWMFKYIPISLQIKKREWSPGYYRAYEYSETDDLDLTYFLHYKMKLAASAIEAFIKYLEKKQRHANALKQDLVASEEINQRQVEILAYMQNNPLLDIDISFYMARFRVVYQTARTDLLALADKRILKKIRIGRKFSFTRGESFPTS